MNKIAFLIPSLECGGAERQLVTLVKALDKKGFDITVLCFYPDGLLERDLEDSGVKLISLEKRGRWDIFSFLWRLIHYLKNLQPDLLHGYLSEPNLVMIFIKPFFPSIRMVWGVRASNVDLSNYDWLARLLFPWECFLSRFADLIIFNSHAGRAYHLAHGFPANKAVVIPNGIDTERFKPDLEARVKIRLEWGISEETVLIGLVGRLDRMKDHPTFLKAAALLCKERQDICFVCVGSGEENYAQELYQLAEQLKIAEKVIWAGTRTDMPRVFNAFDIVTSSSAYGEGFANAIGEAMACGIPCVVTDVGDSAWIVGNSGKVVPFGSPAALVSAWLGLMDLSLSERVALGEMARIRIIENFSIYQLAQTTKFYLLPE